MGGVLGALRAPAAADGRGARARPPRARSLASCKEFAKQNKESRLTLAVEDNLRRYLKTEQGQGKSPNSGGQVDEKSLVTTFEVLSHTCAVTISPSKFHSDHAWPNSLDADPIVGSDTCEHQLALTQLQRADLGGRWSEQGGADYRYVDGQAGGDSTAAVARQRGKRDAL